MGEMLCPIHSPPAFSPMYGSPEKGSTTGFILSHVLIPQSMCNQSSIAKGCSALMLPSAPACRKFSRQDAGLDECLL